MQPLNRKSANPAPIIRSVIFDLDDTLFDSLGQRVRPAHRHAAEAMVRAGLKGTVEAVYRARLRAFRQDPMLRHIDPAVWIEFGGGNCDQVCRAARDAFFNCPVGELKLFRGTIPLLRFLHGRGVRVYIVSFGEPEIQRAKVRALGLENHPAIDHIYYADRDQLLTKEAAFKTIQENLQLPAREMLIVGDRPMREIRAGKELGMHTVRIRHGEFASQEPTGPEEEPDFEIETISAMTRLPFTWGRLRTGERPPRGGRSLLR